MEPEPRRSYLELINTRVQIPKSESASVVCAFYKFRAKCGLKLHIGLDDMSPFGVDYGTYQRRSSFLCPADQSYQERK